FKLIGRSYWGTGPGRADGMDEVERRAATYGLPPVRWPDPWPGKMLTAMRAATFAARQGRGIAFALAGFRRAFASGEDLGRPEPVLAAAAHAGLDPARVRAAIADQAVKDALRQATEEAHARGVIGVPTLRAGDRLHWGD